MLACILTWITSLLKSWKPGQHFKNSKKIFSFLLIFEITNLHVRRTPNIKINFFDWHQNG
jgi:hypothetical protein